MTASRLPNSAVMALSAPAMPMFAMMMPLAVFLPAYYADSLGLGMAAVGSIFALGRTFDVVTDPFAGVLMDRLQTVVQRKTWLAIGALPIAVAVANLFFATGPVSTTWVFGWLLCLYLGWTLMSVGLYSWAAETTTDYHERSRVMASIQAANSVGSVLVLLTPALVEWFSPGENVGELRVQAMGWFILITLPISVLVALKFGPPSITQVSSRPQLSLWTGMKLVLKNSVLGRLLIADLAIGLLIGVGASMAVFFVEIVLSLEGRAGTLQLFSLLAGLMCIPLWVALAKKLEKHNALSLTAVVSFLGGVFTLVVPPDSFWIYFVGSTILGTGLAGLQFLPRAIMADVVDRDRLESGEERAGLYYAFLTTTLKVGLALGIAVAFFLADLGGFDPAVARTTGEGAEVVRYVNGLSSMALALVCVLAMWHFPLGREAQASLQSTLQETR